MGVFVDCPRCGWATCEKLETYSYCPNCNYNSVEDEPYEVPLHIKIMAQELEMKRRQRKAGIVIDPVKIKEVQDKKGDSSGEEKAA
ncbi:MAG: hypothetical protein OXB88_10160 [Bacteriovoracales bacterium]|nr:hypothetical protein [Bacteriovoracales bacterium]